MSTAPKLAQRTQFTGTFPGDQAQRLAQDAARKVNSHADMLAALMNRTYVALATDTGNVAAAAYATLLTANITTVLTTGYLFITFSASGVQNTSPGGIYFEILVDGVVLKGGYFAVGAGAAFSFAMIARAAVSRGAHAVSVKWKTSISTAHINPASIVEEHAHLLVQECS